MKAIFRAILLAVCAASLDAAAATALNKCKTLTEPGPYVLVKNIDAAGDCFVIAADFVDINMDGYVVSGNGTGSAFLEQLAAGRQGVTIRNGTIRGFSSAVFMVNSAITVEKVNASANTFNAISAGDTSTVRNCQVLGNGGAGVSLGQRAMVTGNTVNANNGTGVFVGLGSSVIGNAVGRNVVGISTAEGALVVNNVSRNNSSYGIVMDCPGAAIANTTSNNLGDNFRQSGGTCDPNTTDCCVVNEHNSTI